MTLLDILFLALGLAMDAFAVCLGIGATRRCASPRQMFRLAFHFGLFQAGMPILGWLAGRSVAAFVQSWGDWVALGLLTFVGVHMIVAALRARAEKGTSTSLEKYPGCETSLGSEPVPFSARTPNEDEPSDDDRDPSRGSSLVMLSVATSLDALAVGLSLSMLRVTIIYPALVIGVVTGGLSLVGLGLGHKLGSLFGKRVEIAGGLVLIAIGLRIVGERLLS